MPERGRAAQARRLLPTLNNLGETRLELGDRAGAIATLERALRIGEAHASRPEEVSWARFNLARALWEKRADRPRSIRLATQAAEKLPEPELGRAKAWLASHRAR